MTWLLRRRASVAASPAACASDGWGRAINGNRGRPRLVGVDLPLLPLDRIDQPSVVSPARVRDVAPLVLDLARLRGSIRSDERGLRLRPVVLLDPRRDGERHPAGVGGEGQVADGLNR